ncbi:hypothetical protein [Maritimibacter sp.]|nr:hypothetical protein [Maritimibacter sp.]
MSRHPEVLPFLTALLSGALCLVLGVPFAGFQLRFGRRRREVL